MEGARRVMRRLDELLTAAQPDLGAPGNSLLRPDRRRRLAALKCKRSEG
jgi:hypothetical protein